jgi:hypothetical protein
MKRANRFLALFGVVLAIGAALPVVAVAKDGADDPAGHVGGGGGADDGAGHH